NSHLELDYLRISATGDPGRWSFEYDSAKAASAVEWIPGWISTMDPLSKYYGFNLSQALFSPTLVLEQDSQLRSNYMGAYKILRRTLRAHQNPYFDLVRILVELPD